MKVSQPQATKTELRRAYSLATAAEDNPGLIVLNVRFMLPPEHKSGAPAGVGSSYMWSLSVGDRLDIVGPLGDFRARDTGSDMIVIGGGAGMAPLRAIIRNELLYRKSGRKIDFWYGGRGQKDLLYATEFDELQVRHGNFHWQPVLSEPPASDGWCGPRGFVHAVAREELMNRYDLLSNCEFYICGPPPMLSASRKMLAGLGVPETRVFFDDFGI
jgi:Na+-transporting NADH:ubiquinone oxidoreductase subunit F